ncbi:MAG: hypothetical protein JWR48_5682 [Mycobacterium sp.]|jgi:hypothetical protein|nr:hypothetical protein [Mycobacterium sp.]
MKLECASQGDGGARLPLSQAVCDALSMGEHPFIELLQRQIDAATDVDLADLARWRVRAESALRFTVGEASPALKQFRNVAFEPTGWDYGGNREKQAALETAQRGGVEKAVVCLKHAIYELEVWVELQLLKGTPTESATTPG